MTGAGRLEESDSNSTVERSIAVLFPGHSVAIVVAGTPEAAGSFEMKLFCQSRSFS